MPVLSVRPQWTEKEPLPFRNPIVGGNKLIREAIESPGYVTGVSGWSIRRDGSAEFNEIVVRGDLESPNYDPGVAGWHLDGSGSAELNDATVRGELIVEDDEGKIEILVDEQRPRIRLWNAALDNYSEIFVLDDLDPEDASLSVRTGTYPSSIVVGVDVRGRLFMLNPNGSGGFLGYVREDTQAQVGGHFVFTEQAAFIRALKGDGTLITSMFVSNTNGQISMRGSTDTLSLNGPDIRIGGPAADGYIHVNNEDWTALNFAGSSWSSSGSPADAAYKLFPDGRIHFRGRIEGGSVAAGQLLFTMPSGYRPEKQGRWTCTQGTTVAANVDAAVQITTAGVATNQRAIAAAFIYLDGISYEVV